MADQLDPFKVTLSTPDATETVDFQDRSPVVSVGVSVEDALLGLFVAEKAPQGRSTGPGWAFYQDKQYITQDVGLFVPAGQRTRIPIDTLGPLTTTAFAPTNAKAWYDPQTGRFKPNETGDAFLYRLNVSLVPTVNNKNVTFDFDTMTMAYPYEETRTIVRGAGVIQRFCLSIPIVWSAGAAKNGGSLNVTAECDLLLFRPSMTIIKVFQP